MLLSAVQCCFTNRRTVNDFPNVVPISYAAVIYIAKAVVPMWKAVTYILMLLVSNRLIHLSLPVYLLYPQMYIGIGIGFWAYPGLSAHKCHLIVMIERLAHVINFD